MASRTGRIVSIVVGVLALLIGLVWTGQGSGMIGGSVMSGQQMWLYIGIVVAVLGIVLLVRAFRRPRVTR
ncbi:hypothetical protein [uncultured Friedmanniella sp.]|uniref:hypothetical protein n=1 Tax=uncultured Friedmanniella sp. TaxID=335381 RepID=UPI0035CC66BB